MADRHRPGYANDRKREFYDTVQMLVPKGKKQVLKQFAESKGKSMSTVLVEAVEAYWHINLTD